MALNTTNKILDNYKEKSDLIIRQMLNILTLAHKKVDQEEYSQWLNKLRTKNI